MENKQTVVEWLDGNLIHIPYTQKDFAHNVKIIEKAKLMEREHIEEAFNNSYWFIDGKEYYDNTYGK
jgi:hypothetical protein